jgi:hypothetical protein
VIGHVPGCCNSAGIFRQKRPWTLCAKVYQQSVDFECSGRGL